MNAPTPKQVQLGMEKRMGLGASWEAHGGLAPACLSLLQRVESERCWEMQTDPEKDGGTQKSGDKDSARPRGSGPQSRRRQSPEPAGAERGGRQSPPARPRREGGAEAPF